MSEVTLPDLVGFQEYHGIKVCQIGEDGDGYVALGHHDPRHALRHALAAFNSYQPRGTAVTPRLRVRWMMRAARAC